MAPGCSSCTAMPWSNCNLQVQAPWLQSRYDERALRLCHLRHAVWRAVWHAVRRVCAVGVRPVFCVVAVKCVCCVQLVLVVL